MIALEAQQNRVTASGSVLLRVSFLHHHLRVVVFRGQECPRLGLEDLLFATLLKPYLSCSHLFQRNRWLPLFLI